MKFYTKEWYELMQHLFYTQGYRKVPDKTYSAKEIKAFYDHDLKAEIAHDRDLHHGTEPFDPSETIACFEECYRALLRYGTCNYPDWVKESVDKRLIALNRMPESVYKRLREEEKRNQREFNKIMKRAEKELQKQNIPEEIRSSFCFHDASFLSLKKVRKNAELVLRKDGGWPNGTPYIRIIFKNVSLFEKEKGMSIRTKRDNEGDLHSNYIYLYDEIYRTKQGYEVHILFWSNTGLRYLTIGCEDISFEDNITL